jgi:hypothetical protein
MNSKLNSNFFKKVAVTTSLLTLSLLVNSAHAVNWQEAGDAGALLSTAQEPTGNGPLRNIRGAVSTNADVDLYKIFISDPAAFSASVTSETGNFDSILALFNSGGFGVYGNDNAKLGDYGASLPAGNFFGPQASGWYYLAVFGPDTWPTSGNGDSIAPAALAPYTQVVPASGPGGASPLNAWTAVAPGDLVTVSEDYRIRLSGVSVVPEPETYAMLLAGLGLVGAIARRRKTVIV